MTASTGSRQGIDRSDPEKASSDNGDKEQSEYPHGMKLILLMCSIFMSIFLVALDRTVIATAIPQITDEFHSENDIGWYGSAYLYFGLIVHSKVEVSFDSLANWMVTRLAVCAFQLPFGKIYGFFSVKRTFLGCLLLFEASSALCGAAPSSNAFIVGRALAGVGAAGLLCGNLTIIAYAVPLHKRPMFQGLLGALFAISVLIGPLIGGAFTTNVTWRWCFYINLPVVAVTAVFVFLLLDVPDREKADLSLSNKLRQMDPVGFSLLVPGVVSLLLALQWGGIVYTWNSGRIVALFVLSGVLLLGFAAVQILMPETATLSRRVFGQRSILSGFYAIFFIGAQQIVFQYFLPIWFQAIQGVSALDSAIRLLPMIIAVVLASIVARAFTSKIGYYTPCLIVGTCFQSIGAGFFTTLQIDTPEAQLVGFQIIYGIGIGLASQAPNMAAQTVLAQKDVSMGIALMFFAQMLGGSIFVSVSQSVLDNHLLARLSGVSGFDAATITSNGITTLTQLPPPLPNLVLPAYNDALAVVFRIGLGLSCAAVLGGLSMEWKSVKKNKEAKANAPAVEEGRPGESPASIVEGSQEK